MGNSCSLIHPSTFIIIIFLLDELSSIQGESLSASDDQLPLNWWSWLLMLLITIRSSPETWVLNDHNIMALYMRNGTSTSFLFISIYLQTNYLFVFWRVLRKRLVATSLVSNKPVSQSAPLNQPPMLLRITLSCVYDIFCLSMILNHYIVFLQNEQHISDSKKLSIWSFNIKDSL